MKKSWLERHQYFFVFIGVAILFFGIVFQMIAFPYEIKKVLNEEASIALLVSQRVKAEWDELKPTIIRAKEYENMIKTKQKQYDEAGCIPIGYSNR